jgi:hypothetical protein
MAGADCAAATTGRAAVEAVEALTRRIAALQSIKTDVQQMALNTTLKCARIGDPGKPLSVIAIELRVHAGLLEGSSQRTLVTLEQLSADASSMIEDETGSSAGTALTKATQRMRTVNATVETDLSALAQQGEAVVRALGDAAKRLDFDVEIGAAIDAATALLDQPSGDASAVDSETLTRILQSIAKSYTMKQEREIHAALTAGFNLDTPAQAPPAEAEISEAKVLEAELL